MPLDAVPHGQEPTNTMPTSNASGKSNSRLTVKAIKGISKNCKPTPIPISLGRFRISRKFSGRKVIPIPSITKPSKGTIANLYGDNIFG